MINVVYRFKTHNKINGSLFYCYEYYRYLHSSGADVRFIIVDIPDDDLVVVKRLFKEKYTNTEVHTIITTSRIGLYSFKADKSLVLDIHTLETCKEFLTGNVHCFANVEHDFFRYKDGRTVTYYGEFPYQPCDITARLKFFFVIHRRFFDHGNAVFVSSLEFKDSDYNYLRRVFPDREIIVKRHHSGIGNIFEYCSTVFYLHTLRDTNNRIIPEAAWHEAEIIVEDRSLIPDSVLSRYNEIEKHGVTGFTLTDYDPIIKVCLES